MPSILIAPCLLLGSEAEVGQAAKPADSVENNPDRTCRQSQQELMARVWPNTFVEPANLTVHMSALRRTLRDGRDGNRFIINIPGRGYRSVGSIKVPGDEN